MCCIRIVRPRPSSALVQAGMHMVVVKRCETVIEIAQITIWLVHLAGRIGRGGGEYSGTCLLRGLLGV